MSTLDPALYEVLEYIGSGEQGQVYVCRRKSSGQRFAAKIFSDALWSEEIEFRYEIQRGIDHPCVLKVQGISIPAQPIFGPARPDEPVIVVVELADGPVAFGKLDSTGQAIVLMQFVKTVIYLQENEITNLGLKPNNLLMKDGMLKIADLSVAKKLDLTASQSEIGGTIRYTSPERLDGAPPSSAMDVWAVGVIILEFVNGKSAFPEGLTLGKLMDAVRAGDLRPIPAGTHPVLVRVIESCCAVDPKKRPKIAEVGIWLEDVNWSVFPGVDVKKIEQAELELPVDETTPPRVRRAKEARDAEINTNVVCDAPRYSFAYDAPGDSYCCAAWSTETGLGGRKKDQGEAIRLYKLAVAQGNAIAQCFLGEHYANGTGVQKDEEEAARLYSLAALQDLAEAEYNLGWCYECGAGVQKDAKEAVRLYNLAAAQDDRDAQFRLGWCYEYIDRGAPTSRAALLTSEARRSFRKPHD
jgi:hypothetical protein